VDIDSFAIVFEAHRKTLLRFLRAHGAGADAEDLLNIVWLRLRQASPVRTTLSLSDFFRAANDLMLDRYRSERRGPSRANVADDGTGRPDREVSSNPHLADRKKVDAARAALAELEPRVEQVFRRHRLDGVPQRVLAAQLGVTLDEIERDLCRATSAMINHIRSLDGDTAGHLSKTPVKGVIEPRLPKSGGDRSPRASE